jgi:predicted DCC family thiol-disulfide oxidoreductase YuxK
MVGVRQRYLIYDGDCGLCEACIGYAARYNCSHRAHRTGSQDDPKGRFSLRPYQSFSVEGLAALGLTAADCARAVQVNQLLSPPAVGGASLQSLHLCDSTALSA